MRIAKIFILQIRLMNPILFYLPILFIICFGVLDYCYSYSFLYKELFLTFFSSWWLGLLIKELLFSNISIKRQQLESHILITSVILTILYTLLISIVLIILSEEYYFFLLTLILSQILYLSSLSIMGSLVFKNKEIGLYLPIFYTVASHFSLFDKFDIHDAFLKLIYFYPYGVVNQTIVLNVTYTIFFILISIIIINKKRLNSL